MSDGDFIPEYKPTDIAIKLSNEFHHTFGTECSFVVRAPGRVNLIGKLTVCILDIFMSI